MRRRSVLIVVQNLPVPLDRRVWLECQALRNAGYDVAVICPKGPGDRKFEVREGVSLYKYKAAPATSGLFSYMLEFAYCWLRTALISLRVYRRHRFEVFQACNPPDTFWLLGAFWRLFGVVYVFDQHDLNPELFRSRFGDPTSLPGRMQLKMLLWLERMTYRTARHVIVPNDSYRQVAIERGRRVPSEVTVVRSGPDTTTMRPIDGLPELRRGARYLLAYIGIMGPQDNVDILLRVMDVLVNQRRRDDVHLVLMGFGDCLESLRSECTEMGLDRVVTFTGRVDQEKISRYLSTAHLGLSPDLRTPLNNISTHNKTMEYMAHALPSVSFDLVESRISAQDSAVYVPSGNVTAFAAAIDDLLDDEDRRVRMSRFARSRCVAELDWAPQARHYVQVYDRLTGSAPAAVLPRQERRTAGPHTVPIVAGRQAVDLRDPAVFETFLRHRSVLRPEAETVSPELLKNAP
jgi:glycosyltransferase involved in cell wall biosynthesis